jgi:hypothetical protein
MSHPLRICHTLALALFAALLVIATVPTVAQQHSSEGSHAGQDEHAAGHDEAAHEEGGEGHGHHFHKNDIGFIVGDTYEQAHDEHVFTLGVEYERRFTSLIGLTAVVEYLPSPDAWVSVVHPTFHLGAWKLFAGVGLEHIARREFPHAAPHPSDPHAASSSSGGGSGGSTQSENLFLVRAGFGYAFHVSERVAIVPTLVWDWVDEDHGWERAAVFGLVLGYGF